MIENTFYVISLEIIGLFWDSYGMILNILIYVNGHEPVSALWRS